MLRICRKCQTEYQGDPGSTLCPACVKEQKKTTIRTRSCRACGAKFSGGPRAWYCPECRRERKQQQGRENYNRKIAGKCRSIGSEDLCTLCGEPYVVASGLQRYCPKCAPQAYAEADRRQALEYYAVHGDPDKRREQRKAQSAELMCVVCGKPYIPADASKTCSPECSAELTRRNTAQWEKTHRDQRRQYRRERYTVKVKGDIIMGEKLKAARKAAGLIQAELAEKVGCTQKDVSRWETGQREPTARMLKRLAQALGCSMDELV